MRSSETPARRRLSPETTEALVTWRVCQLGVLAAATALEYARMQTDEAWEAFRSRDIDD